MTKLFAAATLLALVMAHAPHAGAGHRESLPVLLTIPLEGPRSVAVKIESDGTPWAVEVYGPRVKYGARTASVGGFFFDADQRFVGASALTMLFARSRTTLELTGGGDAPVVTEAGTGGDADAVCTLLCARASGSAPGTSYAILLEGGVEDAFFELRGTGVTATVRVGPAFTLSDLDYDSWSQNVQVRREIEHFRYVAGVRVGVDSAAGASVVRDARIHIDATAPLWGWVGHANSRPCAYVVGVYSCPDVEAECRGHLGPDCDRGRVSWTGPEGTGESGSESYFLAGTPAGRYDVHVHKTQATFLQSGPTPQHTAYWGESIAYTVLVEGALPE